MSISTPPAPVDVAVHHEATTSPQIGIPRSRRWILASAVIAAFAVIGLLGTITIRDRESSRSEGPSASPAASAQTRDRTPAELNEVWAAADAGSFGVEMPTAVVRVPQAAAEADAALWASIDYGPLMAGR